MSNYPNDKKDDRKPDNPEDVAALYAWANMQNVKYRDFSAHRREQRAQQQMSRPVVTRSEVPPPVQPPAPRSAPRRVVTIPGQLGDPYRKPEHRSLEDKKRPSPFAELVAARPPAAPPREWAPREAPPPRENVLPRVSADVQPSPPTPAEKPFADDRNVLRPANRPFDAAPRTQPPVAPPVRVAPPAARIPVPSRPAPPVTQATEQYTTPVRPAYFAPAQTPASPIAARPTAVRPTPPPTEAPGPPPASEYNPPTPTAPVPAFQTDRPSWLSQETAVRQAQPQPQPAAPETFIDTRDRASRWFALREVFNATPEAAPASQESRAPVTAVFSLAGGVGKTSLVATLGRALSAVGERVLLTDTTSYGLLPFYYGARELRPGVVRTFTPPQSAHDSPVNMVSYDVNAQPTDSDEDWLVNEVSGAGRNSNRVLVDLATASSAVTRTILRTKPTVIVPVVPDMSSVIGLSAVEHFFRTNSAADGQPIKPYYILNQFDPSQPLHLDVREVLRQQLGDRLLAIVLRRSQAVSEALAEGMTVMDYAPKSGIAEDYVALAAWLRSLQAPAQQTYRAMRWSEK
jgi:cellulose synthase operon protein YhjQ